MKRKKEKSQSSIKKQLRDRSAETETFLKKNRLKEDVIETESGLRFTIVNQGEGASPTEWSTVEVNQRILLVDGTVIKDTFRTPDTDRFFVPPDLAWGKRGAGDKIGAYATLISDIRLERVRD